MKTAGDVRTRPAQNCCVIVSWNHEFVLSCHSEEEAYRVASWLGAFYLFPNPEWALVSVGVGSSGRLEGQISRAFFSESKKTEKFENMKVIRKKNQWIDQKYMFMKAFEFRTVLLTRGKLYISKHICFSNGLPQFYIASVSNLLRRGRTTKIMFSVVLEAESGLRQHFRGSKGPFWGRKVAQRVPLRKDHFHCVWLRCTDLVS